VLARTRRKLFRQRRFAVASFTTLLLLLIRSLEEKKEMEMMVQESFTPISTRDVKALPLL
jgi:hypothetical protein